MNLTGSEKVWPTKNTRQHCHKTDRVTLGWIASACIAPQKTITKNTCRSGRHRAGRQALPHLLRTMFAQSLMQLFSSLPGYRYRIDQHADGLG